MKYKVFFISFLLFFLPFTAKAAETQQQQIIQQIEIIKQELKLLRSLLLNLQAANQGAEITARSFLAKNLENNSVLLQKNSEKPYPIASITKLMSAVVAAEKIDLSRKIILTEQMLKPYGHSPSLYLDLSVSAENLLKASLIQSTNDAAEALSYFIGKENFIALMNKKAEEIGMTNTVFYDSHGLSPANRSTARDLAKLLAYAHNNHPELLTITRDNDFWLPDKTGRQLKFRNMNNFYPFANFIGGKSGYLPQAKQTFASIFRIKDAPVAVIILYSDNHQADIFAILKKAQQAVKNQQP